MTKVKSTEDCYLPANRWRELCPSLSEDDVNMCFDVSEMLRLTALTVADFVARRCPSLFHPKLEGIFKPAASIVNSSQGYDDAM